MVSLALKYLLRETQFYAHKITSTEVVVER